ncbi:FecR family protein [Bacteroidota bacterium]
MKAKKMEKMTDRKDLYDDIIAFLSNEMNDEEKVYLETWISDSPDNKKEFDEIKGIWEMTGDPALNSQVDVDKAWGNLSKKTSNVKVDKIQNFQIFNYKKLIFTVLKIAAVFVFGFFIWNLTDQKQDLLSISSFDNDNYIHTLPDGTVVSLSSGTTIMYPEEFNKNNREVFISGEAHFEVNSEPKTTFIIHTDNTLISVLGTSFSLNAYENNDTVELDVQSGKVLFSNNYEPENPLAFRVDLGAGEKAIYSKSTNSIIKSYNRNFWYLRP